MKRFVVVGVQRSGTTLITTSLDSHPDVFCAGELFKMRDLRGRIDVRDGGYRSHVDSTWSLKVADRLARRSMVRRYLDGFFERSGFEAIGFKLMRNQTFRGQFPSVVPYLVRRGVAVIHLVRENVLKTYLSRLRARQSGTFHAARADGRSAHVRLVVPVEDLLWQLSRIAQQNSELKALFARTNPYVSCTYEQYVSSPEQESRRLLSFIGVRDAVLSTSLVKLSPDNLADVVQNLDAVRATLIGTEFEKWI